MYNAESARFVDCVFCWPGWRRTSRYDCGSPMSRSGAKAIQIGGYSRVSQEQE